MSESAFEKLVKFLIPGSEVQTPDFIWAPFFFFYLYLSILLLIPFCIGYNIFK